MNRSNQRLRTDLDPLLSSLDASERDRFWLRVDRFVPDVVPALGALYGAAAPQLLERALAAAAGALGRRRAPLRRLDDAREIDPSWFQRADRVGYVAYAERFGPTLAGVTDHVPYLAELGVTYLHLMKVLATRPGPNDGGFAVVDYGDVDRALGRVDDLVRLADTLHDEGISLCVDMVMNHTAREHEWAERARRGEERYRRYYHVFPDRTGPDAYERTLPEVFPDLAPGNFTWDDALDGWVWTTFHDYQWDLDYANPDVFVEMLRVMLDLANLGVDVLRLDAVAFTWKRLGTDCQNQPEVHLLVQAFRGLVSMAAPGVVLKAEAIVGPRQLVAYLGAHERERAECHLAYHNQLMVLVWSALATGDADLLARAMANLPATPTGAAWATYVRCHDDIGWAVDDDDARAVGLDGAAHRRFLADFYRGDFPGTFARGAAFGVNPATGDERTCGMTASLCGIAHARATGDAVALEIGIARLLLAYGVICTVGMPLVYMGDELALPNDDAYRDDRGDPGRADDSRWLHRPAMDWEAAARRDVPGTVEHRVFSALRTLLRVRAATPALTQGGTTAVVDAGDRRVFAFARHHPRHGRFLGLANVSLDPVRIPVGVLRRAGLPADAPELLGAAGVVVGGDVVELPPLGQAWFTDGDGTGPVPLPPA